MRNADRYGAWVECIVCGWCKDDGEPISYDASVEKRERQMLKQRKHHERISKAAKMAWALRKARCAGK